MAIRAVNSGASATTNIMVRGVNIGNAASGHTTLSAALTAASGSDVIVFTENFEVVESVSITKSNLTITADDSSWWGSAGAVSPHNYGFGARLKSTSGHCIQTSTGGTGLTIERLVLRNEDLNNCVDDNVPASAGSTTRIRACVMYGAGGGGACVQRQNSGNDTVIEHSVMVTDMGVNGVRVPFAGGAGDREVHCINVAVLRIHASAGICFAADSGGQRIECNNCYGGDAAGISNANQVYINCTTLSTHTQGRNGASDATSPGSSVYDNTPASAVFLKVETNNVNLHFRDPTTAMNYSGEDVSSSLFSLASRDADEETITTWRMGPDSVVASAVTGENFWEFMEPDGAALADQIASDDTWSLTEFMTPDPSGTSNPVKTVYILEALLSSGTKANQLLELQPPDGETIFDTQQGYIDQFQADGFSIEFSSPNPGWAVTHFRLRTLGAFDGQDLQFIGLDTDFDNWIEYHVDDTELAGIYVTYPQNLLEGMAPQELPPPPVLTGNMTSPVDDSPVVNPAHIIGG